MGYLLVYMILHQKKKLILDSVFEVPTEEEHWAMSEEVSVSLHTEKEISYTGMKTKKILYPKLHLIS